MLHSTIVDDTGGAFHLDLFSDAGKLALVAHTASADPDGTAEAALVADNASGIGGLLVIGNTPTAGAFTLTVPYSSSPGVKLAPTGSTAPLAVALLDINDGESAPSILSGAGGMGSSGAVPAPLKVLVQDSENVRIGDLLTLSATTAGQCEANGAGQPVAQATECLVGVAGTGAGVLCACVRNFISTPIGS